MPAIAPDVRRDMLDREISEAGPEAVALYEQILAKGETAEWAAMCALQAAPRTKNTDRTFCDGHRRKMDRMDPYNQKKILEEAQKAGIKTQGKFYNGIGRYTDPLAWSSSQQDVIDAAKQKRLKLEGPVNCDYMRSDLPPPPKKPLAEDLVKEEGLAMLREDGRLREKMRKSPKKTRAELTEQIRAKHSRG